MKYALIVLQLFPAILQAIRALEEFVPDGGKGKEKLDVIRQIIEATYDSAKEVWPYLEKTIEILIKFANSMGIFKKAE